MGMNYYVHVNVCPCCGKPEEKLHIGKKSYGWQFSFRVVEGIAETYEQWLKVLRENSTTIYNEEGDKIDIEYLCKVIENSRGDKLHPVEQDPHAYIDNTSGFVFINCDFS